MATPTVILTDGDDATGMASMLAGLLEGNLTDFSSRAVAARSLRGEVVFTTADRDLSVTIRFLGERIEVCDGVVAGATTIRAPWMTMAKLCSGQVSPVRALADRDLTVSLGHGAFTAAGASFVLSVPPSYYGDNRRRQQFAKVALVFTIATAVFVVRRWSYTPRSGSNTRGAPGSNESRSTH